MSLIVMISLIDLALILQGEIRVKWSKRLNNFSVWQLAIVVGNSGENDW